MENHRKQKSFKEKILHIINSGQLKNASPKAKLYVKERFYKDNYIRMVQASVIVFLTVLFFYFGYLPVWLYSTEKIFILNKIGFALLMPFSVLFFTSYFILKKRNALTEKNCRIAINLYYIVLIAGMLLFMYSDFYRQMVLSFSILILFASALVPPYRIRIIILHFFYILALIIIMFYKNFGFYTSELLFYPIIWLILFVTSLYLRAYFIKVDLYSYKMDELTELLRIQSMTDGLTKMLNRFALSETFDNLKEKSCERELYETVIMFDVDNFKKHNDTFSHLAGDDCLVRICREIKNVISEFRGMIFRYGGEEFIILIENSEKETALKLCKNIKESVYNLKIESASKEISPYVSVSLGCSIVDMRNAKTMEDLVKKADEELYNAKNHGKNCLSFSNEIF